MALNFNSVEPTQIIAKDGTSAQTIAFPTGTKTVTVFQSSIHGGKQAVATFTSTHNFTASMVVCCDTNDKNNKTLTSSSQLISEQNDTKTSTTYLFYAKFSNNTLSLEQRVIYSFTGELSSVILRGRDYSATFYSATDLTVLKYGTTAVWGKPFSLTIQAGANSTVTVNRTSSPNQHAATGAITSGGIVYYGDTLTITATPASGYKLTKFTINGTEYASGQTSAVSQTITVTGAVSVVINTGSAGSWHTIWSGSASSNIQDNQSTDILCRGATGYDISRRTRVTGSTGTRYSIAFNNKEIGEYIYYSNDNINIKFSGIKSTPVGFATSFVSKNTGTTIYLTKVEQYY